MHLTSLLNYLSVTVILCSVDWCVEGVSASSKPMLVERQKRLKELEMSQSK